jgi:hypothetical protein
LANVLSRSIRKLFYERCVMFIAPTERGKKEIDALVCGCVPDTEPRMWC